MFSVVWVTVGLLPLWHDLKIHIISYVLCNFIGSIQIPVEIHEKWS